MRIEREFDQKASVVFFNGDCLHLLAQIPSSSVGLVVTSPPYNVGKEYERRTRIDEYVRQQAAVIQECVRILSPQGSICWQVGNFIQSGEIIPLDTMLYPTFIQCGLKLRNRIVWHFEHGLHCTKRFSGRYETINWFTKSDEYVFDLNPVRVPQKYPGKKHFKGPKKGQFSGNPLGKNPGDVWVIPNVKSNHVEKTDHPCQFPVELVERLILSMTREDEWVVDPFAGVGTSLVAAVRNNRRAAGAEIIRKYVSIGDQRIAAAACGALKTRAMNTPVYDPTRAANSLAVSPWTEDEKRQRRLLMTSALYETT